MSRSVEESEVSRTAREAVMVTLMAVINLRFSDADPGPVLGSLKL